MIINACMPISKGWDANEYECPVVLALPHLVWAHEACEMYSLSVGHQAALGKDMMAGERNSHF